MFVVLLGGCWGDSRAPYSPRSALDTFRIAGGFRIELFAHEPDVIDPVAMEIDSRGRIYVVENSGYPLDTEGAAGKVKLLEDANGDGRPDRVSVFADKLVMPTGVMAWKRGVLVTDPPDVIYLEDRDGDGRAEIRRVVLTGFAFTNPQHTVSSPYYGLDNWIYLSHEGYTRAVVFSEKFGDTGSRIRFPKRPAGPSVEVARRSVRFKPDTFELELLAGPSQFGQTFDAWGHLFTHNNSNPIRHEVIAARYYERNSDLRPPQVAQNLYQGPEAFQVYPITKNPRFEMLTGVGQFTSACGLTWYLGDAFDKAFAHSTFVAEPTHNLVHRDVIEDAGATFRAAPRAPEEHFLASTDAWFRPVNFYIGPGGALYVIDYYREVIEHPEWTSEETYTSDAIYRGSDRGRIYRIVPHGLEAPGPPPGKTDLHAARDETLAGYLEHPNIWWRRTAQRLLVERQARAAAPKMEALARDSALPEGRVHALWTLEGLGALSGVVLEAALRDPHPGVRENAIRLIEPLLFREPEWTPKLLALEDDPSPKVRFQLLLTLGYSSGRELQEVRERLLFRDKDDPWFHIAALTWPTGGVSRLVSRAATSDSWTNGDPVRSEFFRQAARVIASSASSREIARLFEALKLSGSNEPWKIAALRGFAEGLPRQRARRLVNEAAQRELLSWAQAPDAEARRAALAILDVTGLPRSQASRVAQHSLSLVREESSDAALRADAIRLLGLAAPARHAELLRSLVDPKQPEAVQAAAIEVYRQIEGIEPARFLLERWRALPPKARYEAAEAFAASEERAWLLVEALERGGIQPWMLTFTQRRRLIMHENPALRERARPLLTVAEGEREAVLERYQAALERQGDAARGKQVFDQVCRKCHAMNGDGAEAGPDLATVVTKPAPLLLRDILLPNEAIAQTYESYVIETTDSRTLDGVIGPQGPSFVTLRREGGEEDVIQRQQIASMYATNLSAMPNDLENQISIQQMADLLSYIKSGGRPR